MSATPTKSRPWRWCDVASATASMTVVAVAAENWRFGGDEIHTAQAVGIAAAWVAPHDILVKKGRRQ